MSKLDELMRSAGANADESMGKGTIFVQAPPLANEPDPVDTGEAPGPGEGQERGGGPSGEDRSRPRPTSRGIRPGFHRPAGRVPEGHRPAPADPGRLGREEQGRYTIIAGERRWRAAEVAGMPTVACIIHEGPPAPAELLVMQIIENLQRQDLRPIEQAKAFHRLMGINGWSARQLARELSLTQSSVLCGPWRCWISPVRCRSWSSKARCRWPRLLSQAGSSGPKTRSRSPPRSSRNGSTRDEAAEAIRARKAGIPATAAKTVRHEFKLKNGRKVIVGGLSKGYGPDDLLAGALGKPPSTLEAASRDAQRGEAA